MDKGRVAESCLRMDGKSRGVSERMDAQDTRIVETPVFGPEMTLKPEWIDYNDHLNMAYYNVLFDVSLDAMLEQVGIGETYRETTTFSVMTAEVHVNYVRELRSDARVRVAMRLVDFDEKRIHCYEELYHVDGWLAAACEVMVLHVDLEKRKVAPMPETIQANLAAMLEAHQALPPTRYMGRSIGIKRKA